MSEIKQKPNNSKSDLKNIFYEGIKKVATQVHPNFTITEEVLAVVVNIYSDFIDRLLRAAEKHTSKKVTLTVRILKLGLRDVLEKELAKHAIAVTDKEMRKYKKSLRVGPIPDLIENVKWNPAFEHKKVLGLIRETCFLERISPDCGAAMGAILEYIAAEMLELGGFRTRDQGQTEITARHLNEAIEADEELRKGFGKKI